MHAAAALALTAALFHVLNHALFKSLLFFGAGAVLTATGERDMERLGGLIHRMPRTAFAVPRRLRRDLGAAAAQRLRLGVADLPGDPAQPDLPQWGLKLLVPAVGAMLALAAALAAACFVRAFGIGFLGRPRIAAAAEQRARGRPLVARGDARACRRSACWPASCPAFVIDALAPVVQGAGRRPHAGRRATIAWLSIVPVAREPQLLQRPARLRLHRCLGLLAGDRDPPLGLARAAPRRRPGIAAFPTRARRPNTPPTASPSRSGACSAPACSGRASASRCRRPATRARRASTVDCAT